MLVISREHQISYILQFEEHEVKVIDITQHFNTTAIFLFIIGYVTYRNNFGRLCKSLGYPEIVHYSVPIISLSLFRKKRWTQNDKCRDFLRNTSSNYLVPVHRAL